MSGTADDADIYSWNGTAYSRAVDVSDPAYGVPASANVDGLALVDATHFYLSFADNTTLTPARGPALTVQDEDVVYWNGSAWSVYFDGTAHGLTSSALDVDAISVSGGVAVLLHLRVQQPARRHRHRRTTPTSTAGTAPPTPGCWTRQRTASRSTARVDGAVRVDATHYYLSFRHEHVAAGFGTVQDEDVVAFD